MAAIDKWIADARAKFPAQPAPKAAARLVPVGTLNDDGAVTVRVAGESLIATPRMVDGEVKFTYESKGRTYPLRGRRLEAARKALPPGWLNPEEASGPEPTPAEQAPASESTRRIDEDRSSPPVVESLQDAAESAAESTPADAFQDAAESLRRSDQAGRRPRRRRSPSRRTVASPSRPVRAIRTCPIKPSLPRPPRRPRPRPSRNPRGSSPRGRTPDQRPIRPKPGTRREARPVIIRWKASSSSGRRRTSSSHPGTAPPGRDS
jgi:hypothetical protein